MTKGKCLLQHSLKAAKDNKSVPHCIVIHVVSSKIWCYKCDDYITIKLDEMQIEDDDDVIKLKG
jgi:hypothetical protein